MANPLAAEHQGQHITFQQVGWFWCGCNGKTSTEYQVPNNVSLIVFNTSTMRNMQAQDGTMYFALPNRIAMDARTDHAQEFINRGLARALNEDEKQRMTGYLALL